MVNSAFAWKIACTLRKTVRACSANLALQSISLLDNAMPPLQAASETTDTDYRSRIGKVQEVMKEFGIQALVLEPGPAMMYLTGVRWGRSERTFAVVIPD